MAGFIRSVTCRVINTSAHNLVLADQEIVHGSYDTTIPTRIPSGEELTWSSSTCGFMTGTEGRATFHVGATGGHFEVYWDNPFIGGNTFTQSCRDFADYLNATPTGETPVSAERITPDRLTYDDDIIVNYTFRTKDAEEPGTPEEPFGDRQPVPDNRDPKPVEIPPAQHVLVRDADDTVRKIVFLGMNAGQADLEAAAIANKLSSPNPKRMPFVTAITPSGQGTYRQQNDGLTTAQWAEKISVLDAGRRLQLINFIDSSPPRAPISPQSPGRRQHGYARYELRRFAEVLGEVETELLQMTADEQRGVSSNASPMKRLVISAHHRPRDGKEWVGFLYSYNYVFMDVHELESLSTIFGPSFAQVEDIMLLACNTGHYLESTSMVDIGGKKTRVSLAKWQILHRFPKTFPNVQTVWAYTNTAPSKQAAARAIAVWEEASRTAGSADAIEEARAKLLRAEAGKSGRGFASILWTRQGNQLVATTPYGTPLVIDCV